MEKEIGEKKTEALVEGNSCFVEVVVVTSFGRKVVVTSFERKVVHEPRRRVRRYLLKHLEQTMPLDQLEYPKEDVVRNLKISIFQHETGLRTRWWNIHD